MKARYLVPLGIFLLLVGLLYIGLGLNPREVPSVLIDQPVPAFSLPDLHVPERRVESAAMKGQAWLLNVWGTWCPGCWQEHGFLLYLARHEKLPIVGINWRDDPKQAKKMLQDEGNPFIAVGVDPESRAIMDLGVYGAPETFLIDPQGRVRWKHTGVLTPQLWEQELKPLMKRVESK